MFFLMTMKFSFLFPFSPEKKTTTRKKSSWWTIR